MTSGFGFIKVDLHIGGLVDVNAVLDVDFIDDPLLKAALLDECVDEVLPVHVFHGDDNAESQVTRLPVV